MFRSGPGGSTPSWEKTGPAADEALAVSGGVPCALVDLSEGGLGLRYTGDEEIPDELQVDLMFLSRDLYLNGIRCRKVSEETVSHTTAFSFVTERRIGLAFTEEHPDTWEMLEI